MESFAAKVNDWYKALHLACLWGVLAKFLKSLFSFEICKQNKNFLNFKFIYPFVRNIPSLYPLKTLEHRKVFWCFQGVKKDALKTNGLNTIMLSFFSNQWSTEIRPLLYLFKHIYTFFSIAPNCAFWSQRKRSMSPLLLARSLRFNAVLTVAFLAWTKTITWDKTFFSLNNFNNQTYMQDSEVWWFI